MSQNQQSRDAPVQALDQFAVALQAAIGNLTHELTVVSAVRDGLRSTKPVATVVADVGLAIERSRLTDTIIELDEAFAVTLSNLAGARSGISSATATIENDDAGLSISAASASSVEGQSGSTPFTPSHTRKMIAGTMGLRRTRLKARKTAP